MTARPRLRPLGDERRALQDSPHVGLAELCPPSRVTVWGKSARKDCDMTGLVTKAANLIRSCMARGSVRPHGIWQLPVKSESGRFHVAAPLLAQGVADFAQSRLCTRRFEHRRNHVVVGAGDVEHVREGPADGVVVATRLSLREHALLLSLHLMRDTQDLERL